MHAAFDHIVQEMCPHRFAQVLYIDVKIRFLIAKSRYAYHPADSRVDPVG